MKELSIEEKAKRYDEISKEVKDFFEGRQKMYSDINQTLEYLFPELKESEDERIRKDLIVFVKGSISDKGSEQRKAYISWLEKHREPVEINPTEFDTRLQALIGKFDSLPKEELIGSLSFWLNVVQNDGTYKDEEKQGEQKPTDKVEPKFKVGQTIIYKGTENIAPTKMTISEIAKGQYWDDNCCIIPISDQDNWELVEQEPAEWSKKNEAVLDALIRRLEGEDIYVSPHLAAECIKSLKERVLPQSKKEWSEEDDDNMMMIEDRFSDYLDYIREDSSLTKYRKNSLKEEIIGYIDWLKSLRPQNTWKPSDEQMDALHDAAVYVDKSMFPYPKGILMKLYKQLKKLREE